MAQSWAAQSSSSSSQSNNSAATAASHTAAHHPKGTNTGTVQNALSPSELFKCSVCDKGFEQSGFSLLFFFLFFLPPLVSFRLVQVLAACLMRFTLTYPVWVEKEGGEGGRTLYPYDVAIREERKEEKGGWLTGYMRVTF